jgi:two-component system, OmpR family, copper resistance phosphate regulon response regulator CusR
MENTMRDPKIFEFAGRKQTMSRNILYAEDDKPMQSTIYKFLKRMGLEVALADNGFEALSLFMEGSYQIVITDNDMPFMDGLILAANIKEKSPATPVILLTDCDSDDDIDKLEAGKSLFSSIIFKPFRMNELQNAVEGALLY